MTSEQFRHYKQLPEIQFKPDWVFVDEAKEALSLSDLFFPEIQKPFNFQNPSNELIEKLKVDFREVCKKRADKLNNLIENNNEPNDFHY